MRTLAKTAYGLVEALNRGTTAAIKAPSALLQAMTNMSGAGFEAMRKAPGVVNLTGAVGGVGKKLSQAPLGVLIGQGIEAGAALATGSSAPKDRLMPSLGEALKATGRVYSPFPDAKLADKDGKLKFEPGEYSRSFSPMLADLKKVTLPEYLYHGTTKAGARDILANGFDPKKSIANEGLISYTDNPELAKLYGPEVIRVKASEAGIIDQVDDAAYGVRNYFGTKAAKGEAVSNIR